MPGLDSYLVTLGIKGQDVVLSTMDKIRKKGGDLSKKKTSVNLQPGKKAIVPAIPTTEKEKSTIPIAEKKKNEQAEAIQKKFGNSVQSFARSASTLDPTATISSVTSAIGTSLSGLSFLGVSLGRLPEGIAALANSMLSMSKNSIDMAKQSTFAYSQLANRNAATSFYGAEVENPGQISRSEMSSFVDALSGSMGRIQKPLADEINKLLSTKDTRALSEAAAGNWESTGSDKGWMLQQMTGGFQGLPPSLKQKFQASLLSQNADLIQGYAPGQKAVQGNAAQFMNMEEEQAKTLYEKSTAEGGGLKPEIVNMYNDLNEMQGKLLDVGLKFTSAISSSVDAIEKLPKTINDFNKSLDELAKNPSMAGVKRLFTSIKAGN